MAAKKKKSKRKVAKKSKVNEPFHKKCYYCLADIVKNPKHECIPLSERDLFTDLNEDFHEAFLTLRQRALSFGEQKIYNNARTVMFSRRVCYMFIRPKKNCVELTFFLKRAEKSPVIHRVVPTSRTKFAHLVKLVHSDQIEAPLTKWLQDAYANAE
ncbi:MAG: DUF5655 domain-containing protein [Bdellovibrionia bacterium]